MNKKKLLIIIAILLVLLAGGLLINKTVQKNKTRSWIESNMSLLIDPSLSQGRVYIIDKDLPSALKADKNIRDSHESLVDALDQYNGNVIDLNNSVDELVDDLTFYGEDKHFNATTIPLERASVNITWFNVETRYTTYLFDLQSYWINHYSAAMPIIKKVDCEFTYTLENAIPKNVKIGSADVFKRFGKRTCSYKEITSIAEMIAETAEPQETATFAPSATPTPVPLYSTSTFQKFENSFPYENGSTIYLTRELNRGQLLVAEDISDDISSRVIFEGETGNFNERNFIVSNNEQFVISDQEAWNIQDGAMIKGTDFWALTFSPDDTQVIGFQDNTQVESTYILNRYDFPALESAQTLLTLEVPQERAVEITWRGYSHDGAYFGLTYTDSPIDWASEEPDKSGFLLWETTNWEQVAVLQGDDTIEYNLAAFSTQDDFLAVGVKTKSADGKDFNFSGAVIFNLSDPQNITSLEYIKERTNYACAIGSRSDDRFAYVCRGGKIEIIDAQSAELVDYEENDESFFWPYFTSSGILYCDTMGTEHDYQVYLPTDR